MSEINETEMSEPDKTEQHEEEETREEDIVMKDKEEEEDGEEENDEEEETKIDKNPTYALKRRAGKSLPQKKPYGGKGKGKRPLRRPAGKKPLGKRPLGKTMMYKSRKKIHSKMRRKRPLRDNIQGITKPAIRRLARRGGVKRISTKVYPVTRDVLTSFLGDIIKDAVTYMQYSKRKTITVDDVCYGLKRNGKTLYGFHKVPKLE